MRKSFLFILCFFFFFFPHLSFADGTSSGRTIMESIALLPSEQDSIKQDLNDYFHENFSLQSYMKKDLSDEDLTDIGNKLEAFLNQKKVFTAKLSEISKTNENTQPIKDSITKLQLDFYKQILSYLEVTKLQDFLSYIKGTLVNSGSIDEEQDLRTKIENLREKIEQNKKSLDEKIRLAVQERIEKKILEITENPEFKKLPIDSKISIFKKVLDKIKERKSELTDIKEKTTILKKKIELFQFFEEKVAEFIDRLEK